MSTSERSSSASINKRGKHTKELSSDSTINSSLQAERSNEYFVTYKNYVNEFKKGDRQLLFKDVDDVNLFMKIVGKLNDGPESKVTKGELYANSTRNSPINIASSKHSTTNSSSNVGIVDDKVLNEILIKQQCKTNKDVKNVKETNLTALNTLKGVSSIKDSVQVDQQNVESSDLHSAKRPVLTNLNYPKPKSIIQFDRSGYRYLRDAKKTEKKANSGESFGRPTISSRNRCVRTLFCVFLIIACALLLTPIYYVFITGTDEKMSIDVSSSIDDQASKISLLFLYIKSYEKGQLSNRFVFCLLVNLTRSIMDLSADPCTDFEMYCCGNLENVVEHTFLKYYTLERLNQESVKWKVDGIFSN